MNGLEMFRDARPAVAPLDDVTAAAIHQAVFGVARPARAPSPSWKKVAVAAACVAGLAVGAGIVASVRHSSGPTIAPATTSLANATSSTSEPETTTSTIPEVENWREHPERRFVRSTEYSVLFAGALDAAVGRCMTDLGFEFHGNPYQTDSEVASSREPGSYEAAYLGETDADGGCLRPALAQMFGPTNADEFASARVYELTGAWERTALAEPTLQARLAELASCARALGAEVRDTPERLNKVHDDVRTGIDTVVIEDARLIAPDQVDLQDMAAQRALYEEIADELCPGYSAFEADLQEANRLAQVAWIEANTIGMAKIQAEFDEDIGRFRYILEHGGKFPMD